MASPTLYSTQGEDTNGHAHGSGRWTAKAPPALTITSNGGTPGRARNARVPDQPPPAYTPLFPDSDDGVSDEGDAGGDLAVLSPSSVTSPPYWSSHTHNTQAGVTANANLSSESVVPPGAITLQDNEYDDGPDGSNVYGRDRNRACWARSVQVRDYVLVNGSATNIGAFAVWNIRVETLNVGSSSLGSRLKGADDDQWLMMAYV